MGNYAEIAGKTVQNPIAMAAKEKMKLVAVGGTGCGKTAMLLTIFENRFQKGDVPTPPFENYAVNILYNGEPILLDVWDVGGSTDERIRPLCYPDTDVVLLCYNIGNTDSFENVTDLVRKNHLCVTVCQPQTFLSKQNLC